MSTVRLSSGLSVAFGLSVMAGFAQRAPQTLEPFKGVTTAGEIVPGLYKIESTGVSTEPVRASAEAFIAALTPEQRAKTLFPADDDEWRHWQNIHRAAREGVSFGEMTDAQRERATALLAASLSAKGLRTTQDIMKLNHTIAEMVNNFEEYGEGRYHLTIMGTPSAAEPWGWQLDGHHGVINYFVLGDQVVMSPVFMGSEPVRAESGKYAGTVIMQAEQDKGLALMQSLNEAQQARARIKPAKTGNESLGQAYRDNLVLNYAGVPAAELTAAQRAQLLDLIGEYVNNLRPGHARIRMSEVERHLDDTHFAWIGETGPDSVFYYRVQSPVILIEFDHQSPIALRGRTAGTGPNRNHIHSVVRTPNGNDYGKDLLRQHYEQHPH